MLIVSLDRWPDGAVRIAWCGSGVRGRERPPAGLRMVVVKPGWRSPFFGGKSMEQVPYAVRDIAETVLLEDVDASEFVSLPPRPFGRLMDWFSLRFSWHR